MEFVDSTFRYNTQGMLYIAAGVFNITVGLLVLLKDPRSRINQTFFSITLCGLIWVFCYGLISLVNDVHQAYFWLSVSYLGIPSISFTIYLFSAALLGNSWKNLVVYVGAALSLIFSTIMFFFSEQLCVMRDFEWGRFNLFPSNTFSLVYFYSLLSYFFGYLILAGRNFYKGWKTAESPLKRSQGKILFLTFVPSYFGTIDFWVTRGLNIFPIGFLALTCLIAMMAYTIVRHRFFDINVALKKASLLLVVYSFLLAFSIPISIAFLNHFFGDINRQQIYVIGILISGLGGILSLGPFLYASLVRHSFWLRGNISTGLTHELKSPLSSIQGALEIAQEQINQRDLDPTKIHDYLQMIQKNTDRLDTFVKNLLNVAKSEEESILINRSMFDFSVLIQKIVESYKPALDNKGVRLTLFHPPATVIEADESKMEQVLSNLLSNAIKFSNHGTIHIYMDRRNSHLEFSIKDEGPGVPEKHLQKIFDRFYQVSQNTKGSGIGLTIAKAWVEAHGGKIWAESEGEGKGTTVRFTLPI